jgi:hypothetical protein
MQYAVKMDSLTVIYIPSSLKVSSGIQNLIGGGHTDSVVVT